MRKRLLHWLDRLGEDALLRLLVWVLVLSGLGSLLINILRDPALDDEFAAWWERWLQSLSIEAAGGVILLVVVEWLLQRRARQQQALQAALQATVANESQREALIGSYRNRLRAAPDRNARQFILDEMKRQDLLAGANLNNLNLEGANLYDANLQGISLESTNLSGAYLIEANLTSAKLSEANLSQAELSWADLGGAFLGGAKLDGAWLLQANLENTFIKTTHFDLQTRLPDGTRWSKEVALERFTDPTYAGYWRPEPGFFGELPRWFRRRHGQTTPGPSQL
ncbi:MAG: pentapeptide repeat-containing protein [Anaerolineae bacterium]|nr:pentapeptide repeat-containing protein [Anaerolineae bacterium]